jgi:ABC-type spermidine/putrescine transport system permease subunit II
MMRLNKSGQKKPGKKRTGIKRTVVRVHRFPSMLALITLIAVLYAPLVRVVVNAFNSNPLATTWEGATLRWFRTAINDTEVRSAVWVSVKLAGISSLVSVLIGTLAVVAVRMLPRGGRSLVKIAALSRVTTPEIIVATGLFVLMPLLSVKFGFNALFFGHVVYLTGFVVVLVAARAANADRSLEDAAQDLGARPWQVMWTIVLPDLLPAIGAAALLSAAFSFDDVAISRAVNSPTTTTLPLVLVSLIQRRVTPEIDAIATLLLLVGALLFGGALVLGGSVSALTGQPQQRNEHPADVKGTAQPS